MALEKPVEQSNGAVATYHRILRGIVDFTSGKTVVEFASYLDKAARDANRHPLTGGSVTFDEMPTFNGDPRPWAYALLKQRQEWADAKDV